MLFVATGIVRSLLMQGTPAAVLARRIDNWINLGLLAAAAVEGALMMKHTHTRTPLWVHALAALGFAAMGSFVWLDRELWRSAPFHYAGRALVGPLTVYAAFFSYAIIWRGAQLPQEAGSAVNESESGQIAKR